HTRASDVQVKWTLFTRQKSVPRLLQLNCPLSVRCALVVLESRRCSQLRGDHNLCLAKEFGSALTCALRLAQAIESVLRPEGQGDGDARGGGLIRKWHRGTTDGRRGVEIGGLFEPET